jgi:hypothetical protein
MKQKTQIVIKFPQLFTIEELQSLYPDTPTITLRYKTNQAIERGTVTNIGRFPSEIGRPTKVYAKCPIDEATKESALKSGVIIETGK